MNVTSYDLVTVGADRITVDLIVWRRYRNRAPGIIERTLDDNPHLAKVHRYSPFLPVGTQVRIPIDFEILKGSPQVKATVVLWGTTPSGSMTQAAPTRAVIPGSVFDPENPDG
jgi:phage tail protein X